VLLPLIGLLFACYVALSVYSPGEYRRAIWLKGWAFHHETQYLMCARPDVQRGPSQFQVPASDAWQIGPYYTKVWHSGDPRLQFYVEINPLTKKKERPIIRCANEQ